MKLFCLMINGCGNTYDYSKLLDLKLLAHLFWHSRGEITILTYEVLITNTRMSEHLFVKVAVGSSTAFPGVKALPWQQAFTIVFDVNVRKLILQLHLTFCLFLLPPSFLSRPSCIFRLCPPFLYL